MDVLATALHLHVLGYWSVLIRPGEKRPIGKGWGADRWDEVKIRTTFGRFPEAGVGICLGPGRAPGGGWLIDMEADSQEGSESYTRIMGDMGPETVGWISTRGSHHLFLADGERLLKALSRAGASEAKGEGMSGVWKLDALPGLEWRTGGYTAEGKIKQLQSVCPPTRGDDGKPRTLIGEPW